MIRIGFSQEFLRVFSKLPPELQYEAEKKIELFKNRTNHRRLRVHKLSGKYARCWSFSINYKYRIMFVYADGGKSEAKLVSIGDHSIYD